MSSLLEALIPIIAILAVFGLPFAIAVMIIRLIRERMHARQGHKTGDNLQKRLDEFEQRQEQLQKRVQNLETIIVDADLGNPRLKQSQTDPLLNSSQGKEEAERPLKNKLRS